MTELTQAEALAAITAACDKHRLPPSDPGYTLAELRAYWVQTEGRPVGMGAARARVNGAVEAGKLLVGQRYRVDRANRVVSDRVYRAA